jgi:putative DNA primase/helicase
MDFDYGTDYPETPWIDRDGQPINNDPPEFTLHDDAFVAGLGGVRQGQLAIAYMLGHFYCGQLLFVHGIGWHYWDGKRWAYDDIGAVQRAVYEVLKRALVLSLNDGPNSKGLRSDVRKCESAAGVAGVLQLAAAMKPFAATVRDLDADPYLLNVDNGTLDLRTMELSPHNPADRLTKITRGAFAADNDPGEWQSFINAVLPEAGVRHYVQRYIGVALFGNVVEHGLSIWTGTGANGKSTATNGLSYALGDYASTAEPELLLHRSGGSHPTGEMDLMGRRLVFVTETDEGRRFAESTMKRLTGGDVIRARRMRQDFIEFEPSHTPILVTNHLPQYPVTTRRYGDASALSHLRW